MTQAQGSAAPADWPRTGDELGPRSFGPFDQDRLVRYAAISGDDNPLHLDAQVAMAAGLAAPPVHGMLILSCFEPALLAWRGNIAIAGLSAKFLRPILAGEGVSISGRVVRSALAPRPELVLRLIARGPDDAPAIVAEAVLVPVSPAPVSAGVSS